MAPISAPLLARDLALFEKRYYTDHQQEHAALYDGTGRLVVARQGDEDSVEFTPQELGRACGGVLTHNHPHGKPPSKADLALAARNALTLRAVGTTPDGKAYAYTVMMSNYSEQLAQRIEAMFDDLVYQAEEQLSALFTQPKLEREARNLVIQKLALRYNFGYRRVALAPQVFSEMNKAELARLDVLGHTYQMMRDVFQPMHSNISHILTRNAHQGVIPLAHMDTVRTLVASQVVNTILGKPRPDGVLLPYSTVRGKVVSNSAYFTGLWNLLHLAASAAIAKHAAIMRKYLPVDLVKSYEYAMTNPFQQDIQEMDEEDIFPAYDPLHLWIGPDGKQLSDRIWNVAGDLRRKLDNYLTDAIRSSKSVQQMALELEDFLLPKPEQMPLPGLEQWQHLNYEALRLARTETASAHARADWLAGQRNPFVEKYQPRVSPGHKGFDQCDIEEANGPYPKDDPAHIPVFHANCMCTIFWIEVPRPQEVVKTLRQKIEQANVAMKAAITDFIGPLSKRFLNLLFGES